MSCAEFHKDLLLHADGELQGPAGLNLLAHLQRCPECNAKVLAQQQLKASIARVMGDLRAPAPLQASIMTMLEAQAQRAPVKAAGQERVYRLRWPVAIAAMIAFALGVWHLQSWRHG